MIFNSPVKYYAMSYILINGNAVHPIRPELDPREYVDWDDDEYEEFDEERYNKDNTEYVNNLPNLKCKCGRGAHWHTTDLGMTMERFCHHCL